MPNFDTCLHPRVEIGMQMWHLLLSLHSFASNLRRANFGANPFFRPVAATMMKSVERPHAITAPKLHFPVNK